MFGQSLLSAFGSAACTTDNSNYPIANIGYYKMSNATDQLGNYNGTATNVNFNTVGKFGFAGAFNGSSSNFTFTGLKTNGSPLTVTSFSVSMWVNFNSFSSPQNLISNLNGLNYEIGWTLNADTNGKIGILTDNNTSASWLMYKIYEQALSINTWYNLVFVSDGTNNRLYINGNESSTVTYPIGSQVALNANASDLEIGFGGSSRIPNGSIDQIRIYDSAISAANVTSLYNEIECPAVAVTNAFNTVTWSGDSATSRTLTGVGFEPSFTWFKSRTLAASNNLVDAVRGSTKRLVSNSTAAEVTASENGYINNFNSDGFVLQKGSSTHGTYTGWYETNQSGQNYVAWNWKAAATTTTIAANTVGNTIASDVRANTDAGFSIVKYVGNSSANGTVGTGLSSAAEIIIVKNIDNGSALWSVYSSSVGANQTAHLNTSAAYGGSGDWNSTTATNSVFSIGSSASGRTNSSGQNHIAYCFHSVPGYSKVGSYTGTGANGNSIFTGFEPAFVMVKRTNAADNWTIVDSKRGLNESLFADDPSQELNNSGAISFESNGFTVNGASGGWNNGTSTYIFMAIA